MSNTYPPQINEEVMCVLKHSSNKSLAVYFEPIEDWFSKERGKLQLLFDSPEFDSNYIFNYIQADDKLKEIFSSFNFCTYLQAPYQGLGGDIEHLRSRYTYEIHPPSSKEEEEEEQIKEKKKLKEALIESINNRILAYNLEKKYENYSSDKSILAFSHRKCGWSQKVFSLDRNFQITFVTNFGFGWSSYFFTKLNFKGIDIIPFSEWIYYRSAKFEEIIRYSASHYLSNQSWIEAMEYGKEAFNLYYENESSFISKYLLGECEKMVIGLEDILRKKEFIFNIRIKDIIKQSREIYEDRKLIQFRGEKISGALNFFKNILQYKDIISVSGYISRIENCNKVILPILKNELIKIEEDLSNVDKSLQKVLPILEEMRIIENDYELKKQNLEKEYKLKYPDYKQESFYEHYCNLNPEYKKFIIEISDLKDQVYQLQKQHEELSSLKYYITNYTDTIQSYFDNKL